MIYPDLDNPKDEHVLMSSQPTHTAPQVSVFSDGLTVSNEKVYFAFVFWISLLSFDRDTEWQKQLTGFGKGTGTLKWSSTNLLDTLELDGVKFQETYRLLADTTYFPTLTEIVLERCFTIVDL